MVYWLIKNWPKVYGSALILVGLLFSLHVIRYYNGDSKEILDQEATGPFWFLMGLNAVIFGDVITPDMRLKPRVTVLVVIGFILSIIAGITIKMVSYQ